MWINLSLPFLSFLSCQYVKSFSRVPWKTMRPGWCRFTWDASESKLEIEETEVKSATLVNGICLLFVCKLWSPGVSLDPHLLLVPADSIFWLCFVPLASGEKTAGLSFQRKAHYNYLCLCHLRIWLWCWGCTLQSLQLRLNEVSNYRVLQLLLTKLLQLPLSEEYLPPNFYDLLYLELVL